ncbi:MAG: hypothetical protein HYV02_03990 [Deltaproteobacteria bacterium]|nr:hypothetical protein [Deltaproteobacteria bacterium]
MVADVKKSVIPPTTKPITVAGKGAPQARVQKLSAPTPAGIYADADTASGRLFRFAVQVARTFFAPIRIVVTAVKEEVGTGETGATDVGLFGAMIDGALAFLGFHSPENQKKPEGDLGDAGAKAATMSTPVLPSSAETMAGNMMENSGTPMTALPESPSGPSPSSSCLLPFLVMWGNEMPAVSGGSFPSQGSAIRSSGGSMPVSGAYCASLMDVPFPAVAGQSTTWPRDAVTASVTGNVPEMGPVQGPMTATGAWSVWSVLAMFPDFSTAQGGRPASPVLTGPAPSVEQGPAVPDGGDYAIEIIQRAFGRRVGSAANPGARGTSRPGEISGDALASTGGMFRGEVLRHHLPHLTRSGGHAQGIEEPVPTLTGAPGETMPALPLPYRVVDGGPRGTARASSSELRVAATLENANDGGHGHGSHGGSFAQSGREQDEADARDPSAQWEREFTDPEIHLPV